MKLGVGRFVLVIPYVMQLYTKQHEISARRNLILDLQAICYDSVDKNKLRYESERMVNGWKEQGQLVNSAQKSHLMMRKFYNVALIS